MAVVLAGGASGELGWLCVDGLLAEEVLRGAATSCGKVGIKYADVVAGRRKRWKEPCSLFFLAVRGGRVCEVEPPVSGKAVEKARGGGRFVNGSSEGVAGGVLLLLRAGGRSLSRGRGFEIRRG